MKVNIDFMSVCLSTELHILFNLLIKGNVKTAFVVSGEVTHLNFSQVTKVKCELFFYFTANCNSLYLLYKWNRCNTDQQQH